MNPAREDGHRGNHHDEERNDIGPDGTEDRVGALQRELFRTQSLVGDGRLQVEEHVGRDRGAHGRHHQQQDARLE